MIYLKYWLLVVVDLAMKYIVAWPLTPLMVLFATGADYPTLPKWLSWFMTNDNSLDGDYGWRTESRPYIQERNLYQRYINRCHWLWRNSCYGFSRSVEGIPYMILCDSLVVVGDPEISNGPPGKSGIVRRYLYRNNKVIAFQWYYIRRWARWPGKCIRINIGWKLWNWTGIGADTAQFVFSPWVWNTFTP